MLISNLMNMSINCCVFAASACTSLISWSPRDLVANNCTLSLLLWFWRVLYALPAWGGFLSSDLLNKIDSMLRKAHKFGYTTKAVNITDMLQNADNKLFSLMFRSGHCLHPLLPDLKMIDIVLRSSGTSYNLPQCNYTLYKRSFVNRYLSRDCYWYVLLCFALSVSHFQSSTIILSTLTGWGLSVLINDMLCYVMLCKLSVCLSANILNN